MTDSVMMALGNYRFSISTAAYENLEQKWAWRWPSTDRLNRKPARQYTGPEGEKIEMNGTILPLFRGGIGQVESMKAEADKGEPLMLVDGLGKVWGKFCVEELSKTSTRLNDRGVPLKIEFTISLSEYGEDA